MKYINEDRTNEYVGKFKICFFILKNYLKQISHLNKIIFY